MHSSPLITLLGPTASGKTRLAVALAQRLDAEIISADSRQVYRGMDLGTGKDLADYTVGGQSIPVHLVDILPAGSKYNLFAYQRDFLAAYEEIRRRGKQPILCGGSGLYLEAVLSGYRLLPVPENAELRERLKGQSLEALTRLLSGYKVLHNHTDTDTPQRAIRAIEIEEYYRQLPAGQERPFPAIDSLVFGLECEREQRRRLISERLRQRLDEGMVDEVRRLLDEGISPDDLLYYGLEYKYLTLYLLGRLSYEEMFARLETAIHRFAKRQMTWFRGMERRGVAIHWIDAALGEPEKIAQIEAFLGKN
ncbi:MAG: tRNA (adenosine(37)-N6)-dimethylallyltransferase MiaA [Prevotellaceae bacterium]|jgi:tRNA dimethylallyltransferase|nr:tRNA (adenosine(37)-N6)-dimethylallyltransferase MiaA [Prevotellaceae bacterium]